MHVLLSYWGVRTGQPHPSQSLLDMLTEKTATLEERIETYIEGNYTEFRNHLADLAALRLLPLQQVITFTFQTLNPNPKPLLPGNAHRDSGERLGAREFFPGGSVFMD